MGLIRVSDTAEQTIKDFADSHNVTITNAVDTLLAQTDVAARLDKMGKYLDKKFDELESIIMTSSPINNYTYSPRSTTSSPRRPRGKVFIEWEDIRDYVFPEDPHNEDPKVYVSKQVQAFWENASDLQWDTYYASDSFVCRDDEAGKEQRLLNITEKFKEYLEGKGYVL